MSNVKAYKISVDFVANTTSLKTPLAGLSKTLTSIEKKQTSITKQFGAMRDAIQSTLIPAQKLADIMSVVANASMHISGGAKALKSITVNNTPVAPGFSSALRGGTRGGAPGGYRETTPVVLPTYAEDSQAARRARSLSGAAANNQSLNTLFGAPRGRSAFGAAVGDYTGLSNPVSRPEVRTDDPFLGRTVMGADGRLSIAAEAAGLWGRAEPRYVTPLSQAPRAGAWKRTAYSVRQMQNSTFGRAMRGLNVTRHNLPHLGSAFSVQNLLAGYAAFDFFKSSFNTHRDYDRVFDAISDSRAKVPALKSLALGIAASNPYINRLEAANIVSEANVMAGYKTDEAADLAPRMARTMQILRLLGKDQNTALSSTNNIFRALDESGLFYTKGVYDSGKAKRLMDVIASGYGTDTQFLTGQKIKTFMNSAGKSATSLSDVGLANMLPLIALNPSRIGTAMRSAGNLLGMGHLQLSKKNQAYFRQVGIFDKNNNLVDASGYATDPFGWVMQHYNGLSDLGKQGFLGHAQRQNVQDLFSVMDTLRTQIKNNTSAIFRRNMPDWLLRLEGSPTGAETRLESSWTNFQDSIGKFAQGPGIKILDSLTNVLTKMTNALDNDKTGRYTKMADDIGKLVVFMVNSAAAIGSIVDKLPVDTILKVLGALGGASAGAKVGLAVGMGLSAVGMPEALPIAVGVGATIGGLGGLATTSAALNSGKKTGLPTVMDVANTQQPAAPDDMVLVHTAGGSIWMPKPKTSGPQTLVVNTHIDGRPIAQHVIDMQSQMLNHAASSDTSWFDHNRGRMPSTLGTVHP